MLLIPMVGSGVARADAAAEALFQEGIVLFERGDVHLACTKFEESYFRDAAAGTLLNLAKCHARDNQLFIARKEFLEVARRAKNAGKTTLADETAAQAKALEARLPRIQLEGASKENLDRVVMDGEEVPEAEWRQIMASAGPHTIEFHIRGGALVTKTVVAGAGITTVQAPATASGSTREMPATSVKLTPAVQTERSSPTQKWVGVTIAGVGVVGIGIGAVFGMLASSNKPALDQCPNNRCPPDVLAKAEDGRSQATISTIAFIAGGVALAGGAVLALTARPEKNSVSAKQLRIAPIALPLGGGGALTGTF